MSDYRTTTGEPMPSSRHDRAVRRRFWLRRGGMVLGVILLLGFVIPVRVWVSANGYVVAESYAEVRPDTVGRVKEIVVGSGDEVKEGALLVQLDDAAERAAWVAATRAVEGMQARLAKQKSEMAQAVLQHGHRLRAAQLRFAHAERDLELTQALHKKDLASERLLAQSQLARDLAEVAVQQVEGEDGAIDEREREVLLRELDVLRSAEERALLHLQARQIRAPMGGQLVRYSFARGELVGPEHVLFEVFESGQQELQLRVPERFATRVTPGVSYRARIRAVGRRTRKNVFTGEVVAMRSIIQADSQNAYRMAYCSFDAGDLPVPPGASAEARLLVGRVPFWFWMFGLR